MRLEITRRADLGVRVLGALQPPGTRRKASELAEELGTTAGFLAQVLSPLVRAGWVASVPGPAGGYVATTDAVSALDVIEAVDGPTDDGRCVVAGGPCDPRHPCTLHAAWASARASLLSVLAATPVAGPPNDRRSTP
jgi:Rrf2 family iron-sulfur cluster assembly transcriptional regulator